MAKPPTQADLLHDFPLCMSCHRRTLQSWDNGTIRNYCLEIDAYVDKTLTFCEGYQPGDRIYTP